MTDPKIISSTSQEFLDIFDITNDVVILKNGSTSIILTVNALNFGLLAEEEQDAVIYAYARLLNSLNFSIQIVVRSQTKDASTYLQLLKTQEEKTTDVTKQAWIRRYSQFVSDLIRERHVLDKKFYVVVSASALEMGLTPAQNIVSGFKEPSIKNVEKNIILEKALYLLEPKRDHLITQFGRIGLYARQINTQEIIQLFYTSYNPEATEGQQITNSNSYTTALVQAQIKGVLMNNQPNNTNPTQPNGSTFGVTPNATPSATPDTASNIAPNPNPAQPSPMMGITPNPANGSNPATLTNPVADPPKSTPISENPATTSPGNTTSKPTAPDITGIGITQTASTDTDSTDSLPTTTSQATTTSQTATAPLVKRNLFTPSSTTSLPNNPSEMPGSIPPTPMAPRIDLKETVEITKPSGDLPPADKDPMTTSTTGAMGTTGTTVVDTTKPADADAKIEADVDTTKPADISIQKEIDSTLKQLGGKGD